MARPVGKSAADLGDRARLWVGLYLPMVVAVVGMVRVWTFTIDDAYISYRYARNLARGWGLVYNYGERIEGYTNFLWTVVLAGVHALGLDIDQGAKTLGALCALLTIWFVYELATRVRRITWLPCLATWAVASSMVLNGYAVFGLETPFFVALVVGGALLFLREEDRPQDARGIPWSGVVFGLAGITRPEAPLFLGVWMLLQAGPRLFGGAESPPTGLDRRVLIPVTLAAGAWLALGYLGVEEPSAMTRAGVAFLGLALITGCVSQLPKRLLSRRNLLRGVIFVAIVGAQVLWRRSYYGSWLPNTLVAKTGDASQQLKQGWVYLDAFLAHEGWLPVLAVFGCAAALLWRRVELLYAASVCALIAPYVVLVGGDWMPLHRFFAPVVPFLAVLVGVGTRVALERRERFTTAAVMLVVLVVGFQRWRAGERDVREVLNKHQKFWNATSTPVAAWFVGREAQYGDAGRGVIAMGDIGEVGFTSDFPVLDLLGLVDPVIAQLPGGYTNKTGKGYVEHFFASNPRYVVLISRELNCRRPQHPSGRALYYDVRFRKRYAVAHTIDRDGWGWCIFEHRALAPARPKE